MFSVLSLGKKKHVQLFLIIIILTVSRIFAANVDLYRLLNELHAF